MKKSDLIEYLQTENPEISKEKLKQMVASFIAIIKREVKEEGRSQVSGLGTFKRKDLKARRVYNPQTSDYINVKASTSVSFSGSVGFKKELNREK